MKSVREKSTHTLKLSPLETKVYNLIESSGSPRVIDIAVMIFGNVKKSRRASISNSVTSAIRQINLKLAKAGADYRVEGKWNGPGGKSVYFESVR